ncbi:uncharacterized protein LOC114175311 [Vigna unguiculata]|uniref:uncharacterized protein LOC114175311 n=1 Tax=Vigna unguiculata TaxID=3917 RepID=UPI001016BC2C|nr:uncharacterized protein LOC114175311 [Vigna unguiculata]
MAKLAQLYIKEIVRFHGVPSSIVSDKDPRFTSRFWHTVQSAMDHLGAWDEVLPLIKFTYNNNFHASIGMALYEALYGRRCKTPLYWYQDGEAALVRPELLEQTTKKVRMVRNRMQASQSRQKAYADRKRRPLEFAAGDHVFMRLRMYMFDPAHVLEAEDIQIREDLTMEVPPIALEDSKVEERWRKVVSLVKVIWDRRTDSKSISRAAVLRGFVSKPHLAAFQVREVRVSMKSLLT